MHIIYKYLFCRNSRDMVAFRIIADTSLRYRRTGEWLLHGKRTVFRVTVRPKLQWTRGYLAVLVALLLSDQ